MRKVFLLSLLLVVLSLVIPWLVVTLSPAQEPAVQPIPSVTASAAVAPDSETAITALSGGELVETTMADWLPGVVAAEMPASFAPEALRAQAVAARTYILQRMRGVAANHPEAGVCDQYTCCCAHKDDAALREQWGADYARNMARIRQAVTDKRPSLTGLLPPCTVGIWLTPDRKICLSSAISMRKSRDSRSWRLPVSPPPWSSM